MKKIILTLGLAAALLGPLQNFPEFHKAFNCKDGDKMVRPASTRAKIW